MSGETGDSALPEGQAGIHHDPPADTESPVHPNGAEAPVPAPAIEITVDEPSDDVSAPVAEPKEAEGHASAEKCSIAGTPQASEATSALAASVSSAPNDPTVPSAPPVSVSDAISSVSLPHLDLSSVHSEEQSADHVGHIDMQVTSPSSPSSPAEKGTTKTLAASSTEPTLLDIESQGPVISDSDISLLVNGHGPSEDQTQETQVETQQNTPQATQPNSQQDIHPLDHTQSDHLPEPPTSNSSASAYEPTPASESKVITRTPSANRISISYAGGKRRLVVDAEVVDTLTVYRQDGRIEVTVQVSSAGDEEFKGLWVRFPASHLSVHFQHTSRLKGSLMSQTHTYPFIQSLTWLKAILLYRPSRRCLHPRR